MKKLVLFFTTMCITLSAWAYHFQVDGVYYEITYPVSANRVGVTYGETKYTGEVSIPATVVYSGVTYSVTAILGSSSTTAAFINCRGLTSITIPSSVTTIGVYAFSGCTGLTSVTIPSSVISIGANAFYNCSNLISITLPAYLTTIKGAFTGCAYYKNQPDGVVYVGSVAYSYKGTMPENSSIIIAEGTTGIADEVFYNQSNLSSITIPSSVSSIGTRVFSGTTWYNNQPDGLVYAGNVVYSYKGNMPPNFKIILAEGTTGIANDAFSYKVFLSSITIPSSVTSIGKNAFNECSNLTEIISPSYSPFSGFSLKIQSLVITGDTINDAINNNIPNSYRTLSNVDIKGAQNKVLPAEMFYNCFQLGNLKLPSKLERIGYRSVSDCILLKEISIPSTVTEIEMRAFENCRSLQKVVFEEGSQLKAIGNWAFYACHALEDIVIPTGVTTIGDGAFWSCDYLKKLSIPSSVSAIGDNAFEGCKTLGSIQVEAATPPQVSGNTFNGVSKSIPVKVPKGSIDQYRTAFGWKDFAYLTETGMDVQQPVSFNCYVENGTIVIGGVKSESRLVVSDLQGKQLFNRTVNSETIRVELAHRGVYMVSVGGKAVKVLY